MSDFHTMSVMQEKVRYRAETDDERERAFADDAATRARAGWKPVRRTTEYPFGKSGLELVVTYERTNDSPVPAADDSPTPAPRRPIRSGTGRRPKRLARNLFGPSQDDVWCELSRQIGARFVRGPRKGSGKVVAAHGGWEITLSAFTVTHGRQRRTYTCLRAPYVTDDGFRFDVRSKTIVRSIELLANGGKDVVIGDPLFDERFLVFTSSEAKIRRLLQDPRVRRDLESERSLQLETHSVYDRLESNRPGELYELYFQTNGVVKDLDRLKRLFSLFGALLDSLCQIGSARTPSIAGSNPAGGLPALGHGLAKEAPRAKQRRVDVTYTVRFRDLYWMYETSGVGVATTIFLACFGLLLLSVVTHPEGYPVADDILYGLVALAAAPIFFPVSTLFTTHVRPGRHIQLRIDEDGISGYPAPWFRETTWERLRHPRLESRALVLPFSWPWADTWVVIPPRAFTPQQFETVLAILRDHGVFIETDRRSPVGRLFSVLADRLPARGPGDARHLTRFPRTTARRRVQISLPTIERRTLIRRLMIPVGVIVSILAGTIYPPEPYPALEARYASNLVACIGLTLIALGLTWYAARSRRLPRLVRWPIVSFTGVASAAFAVISFAYLVSLAT